MPTYIHKGSRKWFSWITLLIIGISFSGNANAQNTVITKSGQAIIVKGDDSWEYDTITQDSLDNHRDITDLPNITSEQIQYANVLQKKIKQLEASSRANFEIKSRELKNIELDYRIAKAHGSKAERKKIKTKLKEAKNNISNLKKDEKYFAKIIKDIDKLLKGSPEDFDKNYNRIATKLSEEKDFLVSPVSTTVDPVMTVSQSSILRSEANMKTYPRKIKRKTPSRPKRNVKCSILFDGFDAEAETDRKQMEYQKLFSFTQDRMKEYFKDKAFMVSDVSLSKVGKEFFVVLNITMRSKDAGNTYGIVTRGDKLCLTLVDGSKLYGASLKSYQGKLEPYTGHIKYQLIYKTSKDTIKKLRDKYIDLVGILWSSGYEEYPVYDIDILKNQAQCLLSK